LGRRHRQKKVRFSTFEEKTHVQAQVETLIKKENMQEGMKLEAEAEQGCDIGESGLPQPFLFLFFFVI